MQKALVLGATGATGSLLVRQLLQNDVSVVAIVRDRNDASRADISDPNLQLIEAGIAEMSTTSLNEALSGCDVVFSCLGHNLTFKGLFGPPRRLVTDAIRKVVEVTESNTPESRIKLVLMNTTGNQNQDLDEQPAFSQRIVITLLRWLLPPQADNEQAADFLRTSVGQNHKSIEWIAVRPDGLIDADQVTDYNIVESPTRNVIFDAGKTSRINVAHFMCELALKSDLWGKWRGRMPVIYNREN